MAFQVEVIPLIQAISSPMEVPMEIRLLHPSHLNHQQTQYMGGITIPLPQLPQSRSMRHPRIYHGLLMHKQILSIILIARLLHLAHSQEVLQIIPSP